VPSRREFLKSCALSTLSLGSPLAIAETQKLLPAKADAIILLTMGGGMAQTETFDPKAFTPFEPGTPSAKVLSTFKPIPTVVDGVQISEGLENIAKVLDRGTLIRSVRYGDLGAILHSKHQYHWHTGYIPPQPIPLPHMGSWIAKILGPRELDVPAAINIGQNLEIGAESDGVKSYHTAGFLGTEYGLFGVPDPRDAISAVRPPKEYTELRFRRRYETYRDLMRDNSVVQNGTDFQRDSLLRSVENAHRFLASPAAKSFDLALEPKEKYDIYNTGKFGLGCLLARRLVESGARFIEVSTEYIPFRYWDTHENGHTRAIAMKQTIDRPVAQLVLDLEERGLLDRTLVILASEFGRDMVTEGKPGNTVKDSVRQQPEVMTEPKHYGMHRHFTEAGSILMFGGGIKKGLVYGKTADERPCKVVKNPASIENLHATIYRAMGIPADWAYVVEQRPFQVTKDGKGKVIEELFA